MKKTTSEMTPSGPPDIAVDSPIDGTSELAFGTLSATAVSQGTARRHGVADSIRGFGSLDPGSIPARVNPCPSFEATMTVGVNGQGHAKAR